MEKKQLKNRLVLVPRKWRIYWISVTILAFFGGLIAGTLFSQQITAAIVNTVDLIIGYEIQFVPKE